MDLFTAMNTSASGLTAERTRMNLISSNLANVHTTRTPEGGPYKRKDAVFMAAPAANNFGQILDGAAGKFVREVKVVEIVEDQSDPRMHFDPAHPDANPEGYVMMPNVNVVEEMADMITATRTYEANVMAAQAAKNMALKTLEISK